jgi:hypothetical protein
MDRGWGSFVVGIVGFLASWLPGFLASWLPGFLASWLPGRLRRRREAVAGPADDRPPCTPSPGVHYIDPPDPECRTGWGR